MTSRRIPRIFAVLLTACAACGDGPPGGTAGEVLPNGEGPCERPSECEGDVCVALIDGDKPPVYCTQPCGSGCPAGFYCDDVTFALAGLDFCRLGDPPAGGDPPPNEEPPRRPCTADADCSADEVCATWMGERDCTILCAAESECTPPPLLGVTFDVATCAKDEGEGQDRTVCVPDAKCYPNLTACISGLP